MRKIPRIIAGSILVTTIIFHSVQAAPIADFVDDFPIPNGAGPQFDGTETPSPGWNFMWNPDADFVSANYQSLLPNTVNTSASVDDEGLFTNLANIGFNAAGQGDFQYGRIGLGSSHPGTMNGDYRAIYAYTIQTGEAGVVSITRSSLAKINTGGNGIDLDVYVNDTLVGGLSIDGFNSTVAGNFDGAPGTLSVGDTVYVTVGHNGNPGNDAFVIDFTLESTSASDNEPPTPDPMTWASVPRAESDSSITMTATTANDSSGVEYYFEEISGNPGGTDSGWQDSPSYTDDGLDPETEYTYTVTARDKASTPNMTDPSISAAATTDAEPVGPVLLGGFDGSNAINAPKQHSSAVGKISMELDTSLEPNDLNSGNMQSSSLLWGTTAFDPPAENTSTHNAVLLRGGTYEIFVTITNTSTAQEVTLDKLHWRNKRDTSISAVQTTISYVSGSLTDSLGTSVQVSLGVVGTSGHDFALSTMMADVVLAPGETATFSWLVENSSNAVRWDNIALSGTFSDSDYIAWSLEQSWTVGDTGTSGNDDYDLDGVSNENERRFGLDPMDAASQNPIKIPLDPATGTFSYTRRSQMITGLNYPVWYSTDLQEWWRDIHATETPGAAVDKIEMVEVRINPVLLNEPKLFLRLDAEPPLTLPAPELINIVGSNTAITLNFTQELYQLSAINTGNFTVTLDSGGVASVTDASLSEDKKTVTLTVDSPLTLASTYHVAFNNLTGTTGVPLSGSSSSQFQTWDDDPEGIKVFILIGQSNMVGYGRTENGQGGVQGAIGSLRYLAINNGTYPEYDYASLLENPSDTSSAWATRGDVKVWWRADFNGNSTLGAATVRKGDLGASFGRDTATIGPEYAFGQILGDHYVSDDVLIIKTAWGGKALASDFRPPGAVADRGGEVGDYYKEIINNVREVLGNLGNEFTDWNTQGYQIVGIAWHQGFNDKVTPEYAIEYKDNLPDIIGDLRAEFGKPDLPFAIASSGMTADPEEPAPYSGYSQVEQAQLWVAGEQQPAKIRSTDTRPFWEEVADSATNQGFHWNQNPRSYFRIGKSLGEDMVYLLTH